ncbi:MAG TPA: hypothetical protein PKD53_13080 [Chloroflexaceae bacterium]|nr:hypothetical protein [Chloroflexaceae bacterium]
MKTYERDQTYALTAGPVSVIYVSVDEPQPRERACPGGGWSLLRTAAAQLHHMADYVDEVRRSLERHAR